MTDLSAASLLDQLAAARRARERELAAARRAPGRTAARLGLPFAPGDRVFDTVAGDHGRVSRVDAAPRGGDPVVLVQLDSGPVVTRAPGDLINRPSER